MYKILKFKNLFMKTKICWSGLRILVEFSFGTGIFRMQPKKSRPLRFKPIFR